MRKTIRGLKIVDKVLEAGNYLCTLHSRRGPQDQIHGVGTGVAACVSQAAGEQAIDMEPLAACFQM